MNDLRNSERQEIGLHFIGLFKQEIDEAESLLDLNSAMMSAVACTTLLEVIGLLDSVPAEEIRRDFWGFGNEATDRVVAQMVLNEPE